MWRHEARQRLAEEAKRASQEEARIGRLGRWWAKWIPGRGAHEQRRESESEQAGMRQQGGRRKGRSAWRAQGKEEGGDVAWCCLPRGLPSPEPQIRHLDSNP